MVLILVVVEDVLVRVIQQTTFNKQQVLILVVVEDVLVQLKILLLIQFLISLNPCCGGRCSST